MTEEERKAQRLSAAKATAKQNQERTQTIIRWAAQKLSIEQKEVTAAAVAKLAKMSNATARTHMQKMGILQKKKPSKTKDQKAREERIKEFIEPLILSNTPIAICCPSGDGKGGWVIMRGGEL